MMETAARLSTFAAITFALFAMPLQAQSDSEVIQKWLGSNSGARSLKISFSQTRSMKSVNLPARQAGTLWLDYSGSRRFRWQSGNPPQTIVIGQGGKLLIMRPLTKKYERRSGGASTAPGMAALANGFPRSVSDFNRKYRVSDVSLKGSTYRIVTKPSGSSGRGVSTCTFLVSKSSYRLTGIHLTLTDGSTINTSFSSIQKNVSLPSSLFSPDLSGYKQTKF